MASELDNQIEQIELEISEAKKLVEMRDRIYKLEKNEDFKHVFLEGLFKDEARRAVMLRADQHIASDPKSVERVDAIISFIGELNQWLRSRVQLGNQAEMSIRESQNTREELLAEDLAEE